MTKKYERPLEPLTKKVKKNVKAKVNTLLQTMKDVGNPEKHDYRRKDLTHRLVQSVMKAYKNFKANDKCSYATYVDRYLSIESKYCMRDYAYELQEELATVHGDAPIQKADGESPSLFDLKSNPHDYLGNSLIHFDVEEIASILSLTNPIYAKLIQFAHEGYTYDEMSEALGVCKSTIKCVYWPEAKRLANKIFRFEKKSYIPFPSSCK